MSTTAYSKLEADNKFANQNNFNQLKEEVEQLGTGTSGKAYPSLALAMAVLPLPDNGVIFTIDQSNPTQKGIYAYDSTQPNGYRKVSNLYIDEDFLSYYSRKFIKENDPVILNNEFKGLLNFELYIDKPSEVYQIETYGFNRLISGVYRQYFSLKTTTGTALPYSLAPNTSLKFIDFPQALSGINELNIYKLGTSEIIGKITIDLSNVRSGLAPLTVVNGQGVFSNFAYKGVSFLPNKTIFQDGDSLSNSVQGQSIYDIKLYDSPLSGVYIRTIGVNVPSGSQFRHSIQLYDNTSNIDVSNLPIYTFDESGAIIVTTNAPITGLQKFNLFKNGVNVGFITFNADGLRQGSYGVVSSTALGKNGKLKYTQYFDSKEGQGFDENKYRLILGNDLWFTDETNLQLFKDNLTASKPYNNFLSIQNNSNDIPFSDKFQNSLILNPLLFSNGNSARLYNHVFGLDLIFNKTININKVTTASLSGKQAQIIMFGDSITDGVTVAQSVPQYVNGNLNTKWSANVEFKGLRSAGGTNHEGRSSWEWAILIGLRTTYSGTVYMPSNTNSGALNLNPFIKVATPTQISANPTWCFENTPSTNGGASGKLRELNYTESQAAGGYSGEYYTFDFEKYVNTNLGGLDPSKKLIVTNALGFNDLNHNGKTEQSILDCLLGMEIFYNRVKQYRNDAIIGFAPIVSVYPTNDWSAFANYIERAVIKSNTLGSFIIPVWQHTDMVGGYAYDGSQVDFSSSNDSKKSSGGDKVHPTKFGAKQYANSASNFIANKL